ncbi:MAG: alpha/beta hydrolase [Gammaproteobacteria bacterium]
MLRIYWMAARLGIIALAAVSSACTTLSFAIANVPASFGAYDRTADLTYGTDPRQKLDVYVPQQKGENRPVVIFWYGGSWTEGSRLSYRFVGAALAERGFVTVLPDYRLYPKVKFPEFLNDGAQAVAWVQQHAREFGGDPQRVVLMGHSAGGHMAAYLALNREFLAKSGAKPEWIAGFVGLSGPYVLVPNTRALRTNFSRPYTEADWQPLRFVTHESPPGFLAHGLSDHLVSVAQTEQLRDALRMNDVRVEAHLYPGLGHADTVAALSIPARNRAPVLDQVSDFIRSVTSSSPATAQNDLPRRSARW